MTQQLKQNILHAMHISFLKAADGWKEVNMKITENKDGSLIFLGSVFF